MKNLNNNEIIIITGPTAVGKSDYAIKIATENNGIIINADSLQVYKEIPILSAQPNEKDKKQAEHLMYKYIDHNTYYSLGIFLKDLKKNIEYILEKNKLPIIVGGTAMYIKAIIEGISEIPEISLKIQTEVKQLFEEKNLNEIYQFLQKIDEKSAKIIRNVGI